jgi:hypothetical protein
VCLGREATLAPRNDRFGLRLIEVDGGRMSRPTTLDRARSPEPRPTATLAIEPLGPRTGGTRSHAARLYLPLSSFDDRLSDRRSVLGFADAAWRALDDDGNAPSLSDVVAREKIVGIEAAFITDGTPSAEALARLRQSLADSGYFVSVRVVRECTDDGCTTTTSVDPTRSETVPYGWHSATVCGRHGYRSCSGCDSLYVMSSSSSAGPAPAVHCEVCANVLVEWGGSKRWTAELVKRGRRP